MDLDTDQDKDMDMDMDMDMDKPKRKLKDSEIKFLSRAVDILTNPKSFKQDVGEALLTIEELGGFQTLVKELNWDALDRKDFYNLTSQYHQLDIAVIKPTEDEIKYYKPK
jgi:hypothetical protein